MPDTKPCEICGRPAEDPRLRPFCSPRCADVDLGRWFSGSYVVPGPAPEHDEDPVEREDEEDT